MTFNLSTGVLLTMAERFSFSSAAVGLVSTGSRAPAGLVTVRKLPVTNTVFNQVSSFFFAPWVGSY